MKRLTVPHVLSLLALFVALGGTAVAVGIAKNSVGSPQIRPSGVATSDLRSGAVTTPKLRSNAVTSGKVKNLSLRGADIDQSTLDSVRASNVIAVRVDGGPPCTLVEGPPGVTVSGNEGIGTCVFTFSQSVASCTATATVELRLAPNTVTLAGTRTVFIKRFENTPNVLRTQSYFDRTTDDSDPSLSDQPVSLILVC